MFVLKKYGPYPQSNVVEAATSPNGGNQDPEGVYSFDEKDDD